MSLLSLPFELRSRIWTLVLCNPHGGIRAGRISDNCGCCQPFSHTVFELNHSPGPYLQSYLPQGSYPLTVCGYTYLALLYTSRQLNTECLPIFCTTNHFVFSGIDDRMSRRPLSFDITCATSMQIFCFLWHHDETRTLTPLKNLFAPAATLRLKYLHLSLYEAECKSPQSATESWLSTHLPSIVGSRPRIVAEQASQVCSNCELHILDASLACKWKYGWVYESPSNQNIWFTCFNLDKTWEELSRRMAGGVAWGRPYTEPYDDVHSMNSEARARVSAALRAANLLPEDDLNVLSRSTLEDIWEIYADERMDEEGKYEAMMAMARAEKEGNFFGAAHRAT